MRTKFDYPQWAEYNRYSAHFSSKGIIIVTVYSKPSCVQCNATYRKLDEKGIDYKIEDLTLPENEHLLTEFKNRDLLSAPIVVTPSNEWSGYRPDLIEELAMAY